MKRKTISIVVLLIIMVFIVFSVVQLKSGRYRNTDTFFNKVSLSVFDQNDISVNGIDDNFEIHWRAGLDSALVYDNGKYLGGIKCKKEVHVFKLLILGNKIAEIYHFNDQVWFSDHYVFLLQRKMENILLFVLQMDHRKKLTLSTLIESTPL